MYIYIATNTLNDKQYVGKSVKNPYKSRISNHIRARGDSPAFHNAIQKYGADAFTWEVIHYPNASPEALNAIERWQIAKLNTRLPAGYNIAKGGDGFDSETARGKRIENVSLRAIILSLVKKVVNFKGNVSLRAIILSRVIIIQTANLKAENVIEKIT